MSLLSVVIPSRFNTQCLDLTLQSLTRQQLPADRFEVIVVYDGCPKPEHPAAFEQARGFAFTEIVRSERGGRSAARNTGIAAARGERILLLDNDSLCPPDLLLGHDDLGARRPGSVVMGGRSELAGQGWATLARVAAGGPPPAAHGREHDVRAGSVDQMPWLYGFSNNLSVNRVDAVAIGMFDESFGTRWGGEDLDFSYRLYRQLERDGDRFVYAPSLHCWHLPHYRDLNHTYADHFESLAHLRAKHRHFEVELISGLPEVLAGSLADIAERVGAYRTMMAVCAREGLCSVRPWHDIATGILGRAGRPSLAIGFDTDALSVPGLRTFDYGRPPSGDNAHLLGVDMPYAAGELDAVLSADFWRLLRFPDLLAFITRALTAAGSLHLAASADFPDRVRDWGFDPLVEFGYLQQLLEPTFRVRQQRVPGVGSVLEVVPARRDDEARHAQLESAID